MKPQWVGFRFREGMVWGLGYVEKINSNNLIFSVSIPNFFQFSKLFLGGPILTFKDFKTFEKISVWNRS